jgi:hypothetical protein
VIGQIASKVRLTHPRGQAKRQGAAARPKQTLPNEHHRGAGDDAAGELAAQAVEWGLKGIAVAITNISTSLLRESWASRASWGRNRLNLR